MKRSYIGAILVLFSALGYGLMPVFAKFAYMGGVSTTTLLLIRFSIAAALFFAYVFIRSIKISISLKQAGTLFLLGGVCYTGQSFLYFSAVRYIPGSLATLLVYIAPVLVAITSFVIYREKINMKIVVAIAISSIGLVVVCNDSLGQVNFVGVLLALGAAVIYSSYIVLGDLVVKQLPAVVTSGFVSLFTTFAFLIAGISSKSLSFDFKPETWFSILGLVLVSTVLALAAFLAGLERLGSTKASILSMTEPVFTVIFSVMFLSEKLTTYQLLGGAIVLVGAALVIKSHNKSEA